MTAYFRKFKVGENGVWCRTLTYMPYKLLLKCYFYVSIFLGAAHIIAENMLLLKIAFFNYVIIGHLIN